MLDYNILDRKREVTLQHFDLVWRGTLRRGERREEKCLCWKGGGKIPPCPPSHSLFVPNLALPVGLIGRWKRLYRNNKPWEETMGETERWQRTRRRRKWRDCCTLTGQHMCGSGPADQRRCSFPSPWQLRPTSKEIKNTSFSSETCSSFPADVISLITARLVLMQWAMDSHSRF